MTTRDPDAVMCHDCLRWHAAPRCGHRMDAPCVACARPRGGRWTGPDGRVGGTGQECWWCDAGRERPSAEPPPVVIETDDADAVPFLDRAA